MEVEKSTQSTQNQQQRPDYDSDNEQDNFNEEIKFTFRPEKNDLFSLLSISGIQTNTIFIATSNHASAYLLAKLTSKTSLIGYIYTDDMRIAEIWTAEDKSATYVIFEVPLPNSVYFEFAKFFFEKFSAPNVVVLDAIHPNALPMFPQANVSLPVLRRVGNSKAKEGAEVCKALESACPVRGLAGDIFCYCELNGIGVEVYLLLPSDYDIIVEDILLYENIAKKYTELEQSVDRKTIGKAVTRVSARNLSKDLYI